MKWCFISIFCLTSIAQWTSSVYSCAFVHFYLFVDALIVSAIFIFFPSSWPRNFPLLKMTTLFAYRVVANNIFPSRFCVCCFSSWFVGVFSCLVSILVYRPYLFLFDWADLVIKWVLAFSLRLFVFLFALLPAKKTNFNETIMTTWW